MLYRGESMEYFVKIAEYFIPLSLWVLKDKSRAGDAGDIKRRWVLPIPGRCHAICVGEIPSLFRVKT